MLDFITEKFSANNSKLAKRGIEIMEKLKLMEFVSLVIRSSFHISVIDIILLMVALTDFLYRQSIYSHHHQNIILMVTTVPFLGARDGELL